MNGAPQPAVPARKGHLLSRHGRLLAVLAFFALLAGGFALFGLGEHFSLTAIRDQLLMHPASGFVFFVALFALGNLLQVPGWIFLASAVLALGPLHGGIVTWLGASTACAVTFLIVRQIGGNALREFDQAWAKRAFARLDARPVACVAALRLMFQTLPALNVALALSGVRFRNYLAGTLLGLPLPIAAYCVFFEQIARIMGLHA
jgi:uncharacterized membrane protein YdjX (TVP38/TMEM64 family)